jgi:small subunit ribosomal protein S9
MDTPQDPRAEDEQPPAEPSAEQPAAQTSGEQQEKRPAEQAGASAADAGAPSEGGQDEQAQAAPVAQEGTQDTAEQPAAASQEGATAPAAAAQEEIEEEGEPAPRVKPAVPGAHLEVDIVPEGEDPLGRGEQYEDPYALPEEELAAPPAAEREEREEDEVLAQPIASAAIDLAAGARYRATGKRKTAIARVTLRPGSGTYLVNGRSLEEHFPRQTLQRNIRQPLETVGYQERMDVVARVHGGGVSAQAGALRHGVSRALLEADPNLRGELKRRGYLTRDSRAKERKKAGLKKARKRPQFSKR